MDSPKISIITVCYNAEKEIERTMISVLQQTYDNIEYIIFDGNSSDNTLKIINRIIVNYTNRDIHVVSEPDNGIYDAMNKGIKMASGEWLNMMNAGDVFADSNVLQNVVDSGLLLNSSFVYSDFIADNGKSKRRIYQSYESGKILHQSSIYRKELHEKYGLYYVTHPYIVSDYLFFLQVPKSEFAKYDQPISINDATGVSMQGYWMEYGRISVDYMMRRTTEVEFVCNVLSRFGINCIKRIINFF